MKKITVFLAILLLLIIFAQKRLFISFLVILMCYFLKLCYSYYPKANKENRDHYYNEILPEISKFLSNMPKLTPKRILFPLPDRDFDPTESALAWKILKETYKYHIDFTTETGEKPICDQITLQGKGLNFFTNIIFNLIDVKIKQKLVLQAYNAMENDENFKNPISWQKGIDFSHYDGIWVTGGHAQGMKQLLDSQYLQNQISRFWELKRPIAAVCHGVLLVARARDVKDPSKSVLSQRKTTSLVNYQELIAYLLTFWSHGNLFRTYEETTEDEILQLIYGCQNIQEAKEKNQILKRYDEGPFAIAKEFGKIGHIGRNGYIVEDQNYLSGRWPGDVEILAHKFGQNLQKNN